MATARPAGSCRVLVCLRTAAGDPVPGVAGGKTYELRVVKLTDPASRIVDDRDRLVAGQLDAAGSREPPEKVHPAVVDHAGQDVSEVRHQCPLGIDVEVRRRKSAAGSG